MPDFTTGTDWVERNALSVLNICKEYYFISGGYMILKKMFGLVKKHKNEIISDEMAKEIGFTQEVLNIIKQVTNKWRCYY